MYFACSIGYLLVVLSIVTVILILLIIRCKKESFTNQSGGYYAPAMLPKNAPLTLSDCLATANNGWCMVSGFNSRCVPGTKDGPSGNIKCDKWYSNDVFTRAMLSNDSDYAKFEDKPIFE